MVDDAGASGRLMLIGPERIFYAGLLGRPRERIGGGLNIYVSLEGLLTVTEGASSLTAEVIAVAPYVTHGIVSESPAIVCLVIEPESVTPKTLADLAARTTGPAATTLAARVRATYLMMRQSGASQQPLTTADFDRAVFGDVLPSRQLDHRIHRAAAVLSDISGAKLTATECAAGAGLSPSRFLHLFKDETGISFRAFRAWKRARHMLHFVNEAQNLAHLAQQIGYPDSTHFSHSIRRFYGLKPRAIFSGSRGLAIYRIGAGQIPDAA